MNWGNDPKGARWSVASKRSEGFSFSVARHLLDRRGRSPISKLSSLLLSAARHGLEQAGGRDPRNDLTA